MRMRSTGLGKTELKARIGSIEKVDDSIIFKVKTTAPVRWEVVPHKNLWVNMGSGSLPRP